MKSKTVTWISWWVLCVQLWAQPDNDMFAQRQRLEGVRVSTGFYLLDATFEAGESELLAIQGQSVWFEWMAPADGHFQLRRQLVDASPWNTEFPLAYVFQGTDFAHLEPQYPNLDLTDPVWGCQRGHSYQVALVRRSEAQPLVGNAGQLDIEFFPRPVNGRFENRLPLSGETIHLGALLTGTEIDPRNPGQPSPLAWWSWTAPASGELEVTCERASWLGVFQGDEVLSLNAIASTNEPGQGLHFPVKAGTAYHVAIADGNRGRIHLVLSLTRPLQLTGIAAGEIRRPPANLELGLAGFVNPTSVTNLQWWSPATGQLGTNRLAPLTITDLIGGDHVFAAWAECSDGRRYHLPETTIRLVHPNDDFASPEQLEGDQVEFSVDPRGASLEPGEPGATGSIWWRWVAPYSGRLRFLHLDDSLGATVELWTGNKVGQITKVHDGLVEGGVPYGVRASGGDWSKGRYRLELLPLPVPNDSFAQALPLPPGGTNNRVEIGAATVEPGEPATEFGQLGQSVWYAFRPERSGLIRCKSTSAVGAAWEVFTGATLASLQRVQPATSGFTQVIASQPYRLRLAASSADPTSRAELRFAYYPTPPNDDFESASPLVGDHVSFTGNLGGATAEPGEVGGTAGAWWRWTPSHNGWAVLQAQDRRQAEAPRTSGTVLNYAVFLGNSLAHLTNVPTAVADGEAVGFLATAGQPHLIRITGAPGDGPVEIRLDLSEPVLAVQLGGVIAPTEAIVVRPWYAGGQLLQIANTSSAELTAGEGATLRVVWPTETTNARISWRQKESLQFSPRFVGYRTLLANVSAATPCVVSNLTAGWHEFHVAVEAEGEAFIPSLPLALIVRPENDAFAHAQPLPGHGSWTAGTLSAASIEPGEPATGAPEATSSVWFSWQAPASGDTDFQLVAQNQRMTVFEGDGLPSIREVTGQRLDDSDGPRIRFQATEGTRFWIQISGIGAPSPQAPLNFHLAHSLETTRWADPLLGLFAEKETVPLELETTEPTAAVEFCEFLANGSPLARLTMPPWRLNWQDAPPGTHKIDAQLRLKSGEVISVSQRTVQIRPDNVNPDHAYTVFGNSGVIPLGPDPREFGRTNRSWFSWSAPAAGVMVVRPAIGIDMFRSVAGQSLAKLPNIAPLRADWLAYPVEPGGDYRISVEFGGGVSFELLPPLLNDDFENATTVSGPVLDLHLMGWRATAQHGEQAHNGIAARHTQWWSWTAPEDGYLRFAPVYLGDEMASLTRLAAGPNGVRVTNGVTYRLVMDDAGQLTQFPIFETVRAAVFTPLLANDHFANRTLVTGRRVRLSADLKLATPEPMDPVLDPQTAANAGYTAWWSWTAPTSGPVYLHRLPGSSELSMAVFRGAVPGKLMERMAASHAQLRFQAQAGETFHVAVDAWSHGPGPVELELVSEAPPPNDAFHSRQPLDSHGGLVNGWNFGAQRELHEPNHLGQFGGRSVWYRWTPSETGRATISLRGDLSPFLMAVYLGSSVDALSPQGDLQLSNDNAVSFTALAGQEYSIAVDGFLGATGDFELETKLVGTVELPRLQAVRADSALVVKFEGHRTVPLRLEASTNYDQWQPISEVPPGTPPSEITLQMDTESRYFRLAPSAGQ